MKMTNLEVKDFITLGIYNVIFVIVMLLAGITNITPYTYLLYPFTGALSGSFIFLLAVIKIQKKIAQANCCCLYCIYLLDVCRW